MQHAVFSSTLSGMNQADQLGMFRLRHDTFRVRLGWDVEVTEDGLEKDRFDQEPQASYILARSPEGDVDACWRLLPTLGPNMLRDVFPFLADLEEVPAAPDVWELSRFALATPRLTASNSEVQHSFQPISMALMAEAARFAHEHGVSRYVTVTTVAIERMLQRQGLHVHRLGRPQKVGKVLTVACVIEVDEITLDAVARGCARN